MPRGKTALQRRRSTVIPCDLCGATYMTLSRCRNMWCSVCVVVRRVVNHVEQATLGNLPNISAVQDATGSRIRRPDSCRGKIYSEVFNTVISMCNLCGANIVMLSCADRHGSRARCSLHSARYVEQSMLGNLPSTSLGHDLAPEFITLVFRISQFATTTSNEIAMQLSAQSEKSCTTSSWKWP